MSRARPDQRTKVFHCLFNTSRSTAIGTLHSKNGYFKSAEYSGHKTSPDVHLSHLPNQSREWPSKQDSRCHAQDGQRRRVLKPARHRHQRGVHAEGRR